MLNLNKIVVGIMPMIMLGAVASVGIEWNIFEKENFLTKSANSISVEILIPREGYVYFNGREIFSLKIATIIIGPIKITANAESSASIERVEFCMGNEIKHIDYYPSYHWICDKIISSRTTIGVRAYDYGDEMAEKEIPVWMFNRKSLPDTPPQPCIVEPSNSWVLFDPDWKTIVICEKDIVLQAVELNLAEDIVSTVFEYSKDKINWIEIGRDDYPGFEGIFLPDPGGMIGDTGWSTRWDLSEMEEGFYYIRATMTDERGQAGSHVKKVYYDPTPPMPRIVKPSFEETVGGIVEFMVTTEAENIVSTKLMLFHEPISSLSSLQGGGAWHNQSTGNLSTNDLPADCPWREGPCCPIAATNALAGQSDSRLYPFGVPNNLAMADMLAAKMGTTNKGTNAFKKVKDMPDYDIYEPDNVGKGINDYLAELGINCSNPTGYTVKVYGIQINSSGGGLHPVLGSSTANFETYSRAIREGQAVILIWMDWKAGADGRWGTPDDTVGGSHAIAGRGCCNNGTQRGQATDHPMSYTDVDGQDHTFGWRDYQGACGNFSVLQGANTWNLMVAAMYVICIKNATWVPLDDGMYIPEEDAWTLTWDTTEVEDGFYTLAIEMEDSNGFIGRESIIVEVNNTPQDEMPPVVEISFPENNSTVSLPHINITGYASDVDSGIALMEYVWEWEGGRANDNKNYEPPRSEIPFKIEIFELKEGWNKITVIATDAAGNYGSDSVTIFYLPQEDITPPITTKEVGNPNWEDGYAVTNYTPIWLNATDDMSGVDYIYYEIWWDSNENGIIDMDEMVTSEVIHVDTIKIYFGNWNLKNLVGICWFAVDNAGNEEFIHCQEHYVII